MKIAIAGSSGLIGTALKNYLHEQGYKVLSLVRRETKSSDEIFWDPRNNILDAASLEKVDVVINLCGENIAQRRWSENQKTLIISSRLQSTRFLVQKFKEIQQKPKVFISASAIGYYGSRGESNLDESSEVGQGFLPELCKKWEDCAAEANSFGLRVVTPRIGIVLSSNGGALSRMLPVFKLGLGAPLGSGKQYMSWISITDITRAFEFVACNERIQGAVNFTAPAPVTNEVFSRQLARILRRPCFFKVPSLIVSLLLGQMGTALLLEGAKVLPGKLVKHDFVFRHHELQDALKEELG